MKREDIKKSNPEALEEAAQKIRELVNIQPTEEFFRAIENTEDKIQDHIESTTVKKSDKDGWVDSKLKSSKKKRPNTSQVILNDFRYDIRFINRWKSEFNKVEGCALGYFITNTIKSRVTKNNTLISEVKSEELKEREVKEFERLVAEFVQIKKELGLK